MTVAARINISFVVNLKVPAHHLDTESLRFFSDVLTAILSLFQPAVLPEVWLRFHEMEANEAKLLDFEKLQISSSNLAA